MPPCSANTKRSYRRDGGRRLIFDIPIGAGRCRMLAIGLLQLLKSVREAPLVQSRQ